MSLVNLAPNGSNTLLGLSSKYFGLADIDELKNNPTNKPNGIPVNNLMNEY